MNRLSTTVVVMIAAAITMAHGHGIADAAASDPDSTSGNQWKITLHVDRSQLNTQEELERVHAQMLSKARALCREPGLRDLRSRMAQRQCRDDIMMQIALAIDSKPLLALAQARMAGGAAPADAS